MRFNELPESAQKAVKDAVLDHYPEEVPKIMRLGEMVEDGKTAIIEICGIQDSFGHATLEKTGKCYDFQGYKKKE